MDVSSQNKLWTGMGSIGKWSGLKEGDRNILNMAMAKVDAGIRSRQARVQEIKEKKVQELKALQESQPVTRNSEIRVGDILVVGNYLRPENALRHVITAVYKQGEEICLNHCASRLCQKPNGGWQDKGFMSDEFEGLVGRIYHPLA